MAALILAELNAQIDHAKLQTLHSESPKRRKFFFGHAIWLETQRDKLHSVVAHMSSANSKRGVIQKDEKQAPDGNVG